MDFYTFPSKFGGKIDTFPSFWGEWCSQASGNPSSIVDDTSTLSASLQRTCLGVSQRSRKLWVKRKNNQSPAEVRGDGKACYNRMRLFMTGSCSFG